MAIPNYSNYNITPHSKERLIERFNLSKNDVKQWVQRFMTQASFVESQPNNRQKWRKDDIVMIIDIKQKTIVTVYSTGINDEPVGKQPLNPELASEVKRNLDDFTSKKKRDLGGKVANLLQTMAETSSKMVKPYTNFRYSDALYDELIKEYQDLSDEIDKNTEVIAEANRFKNNLYN